MDRLQRAFTQAGSQQQADAPQVDTAEHVYISSLALLKMLKHGALPPPIPNLSNNSRVTIL